MYLGVGCTAKLTALPRVGILVKIRWQSKDGSSFSERHMARVFITKDCKKGVFGEEAFRAWCCIKTKNEVNLTMIDERRERGFQVRLAHVDTVKWFSKRHSVKIITMNGLFFVQKAFKCGV